MLWLPSLQSAVLYLESMMGQENVQTLAMVRKLLNTPQWHGSNFVSGATKGGSGGKGQSCEFAGCLDVILTKYLSSTYLREGSVSFANFQ